MPPSYKRRHCFVVPMVYSFPLLPPPIHIQRHAALCAGVPVASALYMQLVFLNREMIKKKKRKHRSEISRIRALPNSTLRHGKLPNEQDNGPAHVLHVCVGKAACRGGVWCVL